MLWMDVGFRFVYGFEMYLWRGWVCMGGIVFGFGLLGEM